MEDIHRFHQVNVWLHRGLCLGSFVGAAGIIPLTIALLDTGHYANTEQDKIIIAAMLGSLLAMHGIYKNFNINTRIKNAILQRYIDALSIKQLLYRIPIKSSHKVSKAFLLQLKLEI